MAPCTIGFGVGLAHFGCAVALRARNDRLSLPQPRKLAHLSTSRPHSVSRCSAVQKDIGNATQEIKKHASSAYDVVLAFYTAVNSKNIDAAVALVARDVEYQDFTYAEPKKGREEVKKFLTKISSFVPDDLVYVFDDVTTGDDNAVGVVWHVELGGVPFPNARGCSFYRLNNQGQIVFARDIVESPLKLGDAAIQLLGVLAPLVRKFGPNPSLPIPPKSLLVWAFFIGYVASVMFGDFFPGLPGAQTPLATFQQLFNLSLNFFYVTIAVNATGLSWLQAPVEPPVYEGVFNFINAWSLMFLPLLLADRRSQHMDNRVPLWLGIFFVTNFFFVPYIALREAQPEVSSGAPAPPPAWAPLVGATGLAIAAVSIPWVLLARPEFGGLVERWDYFVSMMSNDRVFFAFIVDMLLYSVWQALLLEGAPAGYRLVPYFGLAAWLVTRGQAQYGSGDKHGGQE